MIILDRLTKKYNKRSVLDELSLTIKAGEFVCIVGQSGAGKTTLLHALIGALQPDSGRIAIFGKEITKMNRREIQDYRRSVGIIFQDYKLLPQKTVFENVAFALEVAGYDKQFIASRTIDALKIVGMEEHRNSFPSQLSGGEAQRTAIARALVHAPEILFADEPTGNLDPENTMALAKLFKRINDSGTTIILSTHDKEVVDFLQKRVITLDNGRLVSDI
ncbi:ATP-binding cassette domain-containing protein [Candidatus Gracilibacteria bacterium]|nr:ATP-binding cassette domain-containing protein [Candidatus Gracilibacteria bacterium]